MNYDLIYDLLVVKRLVRTPTAGKRPELVSSPAPYNDLKFSLRLAVVRMRAMFSFVMFLNQRVL